MTIFSSFSVARTGLIAQQRAIGITGQNIANVNTPGYSRQRANFAPLESIFAFGGSTRGGGVELTEVQRLVDLGIQTQLQRERSRLSFDESLEDGITSVAAVLDDLSGGGLSEPLDALFKTLNDLANNPSELGVRESTIQSAAALASRIQTADLRLEQVETQVNSEIAQSVAEVNNISSEIASINRQIRENQFSGGTANELRDRRTLLLEELGRQLDFTSFEREDGTVAVFVAGGFVLVDGEARAELAVGTDQPTPLADPTFFNIFQVQNGSRQGPITNRISGGRIGAQLDLRDDRVQFYRQQLDRFAFSLASRVNTVHAAGRGLVDANARNFFVDGQLAVAGVPPGTALTSVLGAAGRIAVNPDLFDDPRHLAAGTPAAGPAAPGDNTNALDLAALQALSVATFQIGDPAAGPATGEVTTLNQFLGSLNGTLGAELGSLRTSVESDELVVTELQGRRDAVSGVSIDEEVTNLVRFQRSFEASARVLSTLDELLQSLIAL